MAQDVVRPIPTTTSSSGKEGGDSRQFSAEGEVPGDLEAIRAAALAWREGPLKKSLAKMPARSSRFATWSDLDVPDLLTPADAPIDYMKDLGLPGRVPVHARRAADDVPRAASGRCACSPASARPSRRTSASSTCSRRARPGSRPPSISRRSWATTPTRPRSLGEVGHVRRRRRHAARHGGPVRRHPARPGHDVDDHQRAGDRAARVLRRARRQARHPARRARRHGAERLPQGVHRAERVARAAAAGDAHRHRHDRVLHDARCRAGTPSRSAAITSARPARRPRRSSRSRSPTASATCESASSAGSTSTSSRRGSRFFFDVHNDFFEEIAKFRAARRMWARLMKERFGAKKRREHDAAHARADGRRVADGAAAATTTSCASRCRRSRRCSAGRSRCTPTRSTRPTRCRPRRP